MTENGRFFELSQDGPVLLVDVCREIGSLADHKLARELQVVIDRIKSDGIRHVLVDFERIPYFGSVMLEALLAFWNQARATGGKLVICNVSEVGREVLEVARFTTIWPVFNSRAAACEFLNSAKS